MTGSSNEPLKSEERILENGNHRDGSRTVESSSKSDGRCTPSVAVHDSAYESRWQLSKVRSASQYTLKTLSQTAASVISDLLHRYHFCFAPEWLESVPKVQGIMDFDDKSPLYNASLSFPMKFPAMVVAGQRED